MALVITASASSLVLATPPVGANTAPVWLQRAHQAPWGYMDTVMSPLWIVVTWAVVPVSGEYVVRWVLYPTQLHRPWAVVGILMAPIVGICVGLCQVVAVRHSGGEQKKARGRIQKSPKKRW